MTTQYTVVLTETEKKGLDFIAINPQEWIDNAAHERARIAIDDIVKIAVQKSLEIGQSIPGTKEEIVDLAYENGWVKTLAERQADLIAQFNEQNGQ